MFFIVGMGRSGTVFLSNLLDGVESTAVFHEFSADRSELVRSYLTAERGDVYLRGARARVIASRIMHTKCRVYGEVNSYLRYHISGLQRLYQANVLHLVRDGRAVVRSIMNRKAYTASDQRHTGQIRPKPGDPYEVQWEHMERFERVCWYWARTNQDILSHDLPLIRLEDITQDYTAFQAQVLHPLGLAIDWADWKKVCDQPKNVSEAASFPEESQWTQKQIGQFDAICGPVMERLGY